MPTALDYEEIRQLSSRYCVGADARDLDGMVALFVDDIDVGRHGRGREALRSYLASVLRGYGPSLHHQTTHSIVFADDEHATGTAYCIIDHQSVDEPPVWFIESLAFFDTYEKRDGAWYFMAREYHGMWLDHVNHPDRDALERELWDDTGSAHQRLPQPWSTWDAFWARST